MESCCRSGTLCDDGYQDDVKYLLKVFEPPTQSPTTAKSTTRSPTLPTISPTTKSSTVHTITPPKEYIYISTPMK